MQYDTRKDIALANVERLGKQMLHKGCSFILKSNFATAFSYISDGYDLITCDCPRGSWFTDTYDQRETIIQLASLEMAEPEFHFCLSFALFYISLGEDGGGKDMDLLAQSLKHIDKYLSYQVNHLGYYFKGRVLSSMEQRPEAIAYYDLSFKSKVNTPALYRASMLRERDSSSGLYGLYQACLSNPSSICAWEHLHDLAVVKRGIAIPTEKALDKHNTLASQFNNSSFWSLDQTFWFLFRGVKSVRQSTYRSFDESLRSTGNDDFIRYKYNFSSDIYSNSEHLKDFQDFVSIMDGCARLFNEPAVYSAPVSSNTYYDDYQDEDDSDWGGDIDNNEYYNDDLDMDQQSQEFWDNL